MVKALRLKKRGNSNTRSNSNNFPDQGVIKASQDLSNNGKPSSDQGFTQVPNCVITDTGLSIQARFLYVVLDRYCWDKDFCFPSQETLGNDMGFTARHVRNLLEELENAGYIEITRPAYESTNCYILKKLPASKRHRKHYHELFRKSEE